MLEQIEMFQPVADGLLGGSGKFRIESDIPVGNFVPNTVYNSSFLLET
jgi:hypothetical protein